MSHRLIISLLLGASTVVACHADGSTADGDGPLAGDSGLGDLTPPVTCGNRTVEAGEACDDGDDNGAYGHCASDCQALGPSCGDGTTDIGNELCDDGGYGFCAMDCQGLAAHCGDGIIDSLQEICDDGDDNGNYGHCLATCQGMGGRCGDQTVDHPHEQCDDGNRFTQFCSCDQPDCTVCSSDCQWATGQSSLECPGALNPWMQLVMPTSAWVQWETPSLHESCVQWGPTPSLGATTCGGPVGGNSGSVIHEVELEPLSADHRYFYSIYGGPVFDFVTPAQRADEAPIRLVVISDVQFNHREPTKYSEIIHAGIMSFISNEVSPDLAREITGVLVSGDLIADGVVYSQWQETFFRPAADLMAHVPFYPVQGNHDVTSLAFRSYFHLPEDYGNTLCTEYHYSFDISNVRIIGLNTANVLCMLGMFNWLSDTLDSAAVDPAVDFVFAQFHHPYKSELWPPGESATAAILVHSLEDFTAESGKPSVHFFGHTHGYSRGQSRDVRHLWVNSASASGYIDYWGDYDQIDYDEFTVSFDDYGFVIVEVWAGADPGFHLRRVSRGDQFVTLENELLDDITVRLLELPPETPTAVHPREGETAPGAGLDLRASPFIDPDGRLHGASHWQVSSACPGFASLIHESWKQHENWFFDQDLQSGDDLTDEWVTDLPGGTELCWRVRYRDRGLAWSAWSEPARFVTAP